MDGLLEHALAKYGTYSPVPLRGRMCKFGDLMSLANACEAVVQGAGESRFGNSKKRSRSMMDVVCNLHDDGTLSSTPPYTVDDVVIVLGAVGVHFGAIDPSDIDRRVCARLGVAAPGVAGSSHTQSLVPAAAAASGSRGSDDGVVAALVASAALMSREELEAAFVQLTQSVAVAKNSTLRWKSKSRNQAIAIDRLQRKVGEQALVLARTSYLKDYSYCCSYAFSCSYFYPTLTITFIVTLTLLLALMFAVTLG